VYRTASQAFLDGDENDEDVATFGGNK